MKIPWCCLLIACLGLPAAAYGQITALAPPKSAQEKDEPATVKLVMYPAPEPRPAMKYFLYPPLVDRRPGNAAVLYGKVTAERQGFFGNGELMEKIAKWVDMPLEKLPKDEVRKAIPRFPMLDRAARLESVDWELPIHEGEYYFILLPEVSQMRTFGRLLAARARVQIADGHFDDAVYTLQTGYAVARHASQAPTPVNALVGIAISGTMCKQVEQFVQQPGAPNLYWALTHLPQPLVDMRLGFEGEWSMLYLSYPELRDVEKKDLSPDEWRRMYESLGDRVRRWAYDSSQKASPWMPLAAAGVAVSVYPQAKERMISRGYTASQVEAMPVAKVLLLDTVLGYNEFRDEMLKWSAVPWPEAQKGLAAADRHLRAVESQGGILLVRRDLLPVVEPAYRAQVRHERTIAVLRIVEAIRLYGASHAGQLPDKLDDIAAVPIPSDPTTGQPFVYRRTGDRAVLESPGGKYMGMRYEITFAPKGNSR